MFQDTKITEIPLNELIDWRVDEYGIACRNQADFVVKYYDITIEGREVRSWMQPLFKATGKAIFGLITCERDGVKKILVSTSFVDYSALICMMQMNQLLNIQLRNMLALLDL